MNKNKKLSKLTPLVLASSLFSSAATAGGIDLDKIRWENSQGQTINPVTEMPVVEEVPQVEPQQEQPPKAYFLESGQNIGIAPLIEGRYSGAVCESQKGDCVELRAQEQAREAKLACMQNTHDTLQLHYVPSNSSQPSQEWRLLERDLEERGTIGQRAERRLEDVLSGKTGELIVGDTIFGVTNGNIETENRGDFYTLMDKMSKWGDRGCNDEDIPVYFQEREFQEPQVVEEPQSVIHSNSRRVSSFMPQDMYRTYLDEYCGPNGADLVMRETDGEFTIVYNPGSENEEILNNRSPAYVAGKLMDVNGNVSKFQRDNVDAEVAVLAQRDHREDTNNLAAEVFSDRGSINRYGAHNMALASTQMGIFGSIGTMMEYAHATAENSNQRAELYDGAASRFVSQDGLLGGLWSLIVQEGFTRNGSMFHNPRDEATNFLAGQYRTINGNLGINMTPDEIKSSINTVRDNTLQFTNQDAYRWEKGE